MRSDIEGMWGGRSDQKDDRVKGHCRRAGCLRKYYGLILCSEGVQSFAVVSWRGQEVKGAFAKGAGVEMSLAAEKRDVDAVGAVWARSEMACIRNDWCGQAVLVFMA